MGNDWVMTQAGVCEMERRRGGSWKGWGLWLGFSLCWGLNSGSSCWATSPALFIFWSSRISLRVLGLQACVTTPSSSFPLFLSYPAPLFKVAEAQGGLNKPCWPDVKGRREGNGSGGCTQMSGTWKLTHSPTPACRGLTVYSGLADLAWKRPAEWLSKGQVYTSPASSLIP